VIPAFKDASRKNREASLYQAAGFVVPARVDEGGNIRVYPLFVGGIPLVEFPGCLEGCGVITHTPFNGIRVEEVLGRTPFREKAVQIGPGFPPGFPAYGIREGQVHHQERRVPGGQQAAQEFPAFDLVFRAGRFHKEPGGVNRSFVIIGISPQNSAKIIQGGIPVAVTFGLDPGPKKEVEAVIGFPRPCHVQRHLGLKKLPFFHQDMGPHQNETGIPAVALEDFGDSGISTGPVPVVIVSNSQLPFYREIVGIPDDQIRKHTYGFLPFTLDFQDPGKAQSGRVTVYGELISLAELVRRRFKKAGTFVKEPQKKRGQDGIAV
jgi:hypothetical protein